MSEIQNSQFYPQQQPMVPMSKEMLKAQVKYDREMRPPLSAPDEFVRQRKKNGLIERLYDGIKNLTGLGIGSKKVKAELAKVESGEITEEQAKETIDKYRKSQVNSAQGFGDLMSVGASGLTFFGLRNYFKILNTSEKLNKKYYDAEARLRKGYQRSKPWLFRTIENIPKSNPKLMAVAVAASALAGGFAKASLLKLNRIGAGKEVDKKDFNGAKTPYDKAAYKYEKKMAKKERPRNFLSGMVNGLLMPISILGGGIIGVPLYLIGNSLNRYFVADKEDKNKSLNGYVDNLKNDSITHVALAAATAVPMLKKAHYTSIFDKNLKASFDKLKNVTLQASEFEGQTVYKELEDVLLGSENIRKLYDEMGKTRWKKINELAEEIEKKEGLSSHEALDEAYERYNNNCSEIIEKLTEENIFAVKFEQIKGNWSPLAKALKEDCPVTHTMDEAKDLINQALGGKYEVTKLLGVGTIAETYLAKGNDGKEVCIKILKKGIDAKKITNDKEKFAQLIKNMSDKSETEKEIMLKKLDNLADGIIKEVDFVHEKEAAEKLAKYTTEANVVKPIEVVNNVYVMEKANGISLQSLAKLNALQEGLKYETRPKRRKLIEKEIEKIKARTPNYDDIVNLSPEDSERILKEYQKVLVEQFTKIDKNGKVLHADIHPGNIFIDINALKSRKGKLFTLIDTGNTVELSKEQALRVLKLSDIVKRGSVPDIAEYVLEDAVLPQGMSHQEAVEKISEELNKLFFDNQTRLGPITNDTLLDLTSNIMKKYKIISTDSQLNLIKAKTSSNQSLRELQDMLFEKKFGDMEINNKADEAVVIGKAIWLGSRLELNYFRLQKMQERKNLLMLSPLEKAKFKKNDNLLDTNSEKYITYKLKQKIKDIPKTEDIRRYD